MGELGFEEYFFSLMDGGFATHRWGEKGRCRQQRQTQGVPGGLRMEENEGHVHREGKPGCAALVPPLFPQLINIGEEKKQLLIRVYSYTKYSTLFLSY